MQSEIWIAWPREQTWPRGEGCSNPTMGHKWVLCAPDKHGAPTAGHRMFTSSLFLPLGPLGSSFLTPSIAGVPLRGGRARARPSQGAGRVKHPS